MKQTKIEACAILALAVMAMAPANAQAPKALTCPDSLELDLRADRTLEPKRIREIAPSAGAHTSAELAAFGPLPRLAYQLYDVYSAGGDVRARFDGSGLRLVGFIYGDPGPDTERPSLRRDNRDTKTFFGFVADDPTNGRRVIVFRGTLQPNEWIRNLQARQQPFAADTPSAQVHSGFLSIFRSLVLEENGAHVPFAQALPRLITGDQTVFVGHSLGSAIATLAGVEASRQSPAAAGKLRIITFASPRVGDEGFARLAAAVGRIDRVCNQVDVDTAVPQSTRRVL
jgi:hypothetical protein